MPRGRRNMKRRARRSRRSNPYTRGGSGQIQALKTLTVPDKLIVKLPYYEEVAMTSNTNYTYTFWRNNSIYDPNGSGIGHQPLGYDQWSTFYSRYRVIGCKYRVTVSNPSDFPCKVGILAVNGAYSGNADETAFEQPHMKTHTVGSHTGKDVIEFTKYLANPRIVGVAPSAYRADDNYQALFGTNPLEQISAIIQARSMGAGSTVNLMLNLHITYFVELFDRKMLPLSNTSPEYRGPTEPVNEV